jgi:hypothetical protein
MAADLDEHVDQFRHRPWGRGPFTFVAADALTMKVREGGRVINAVVLVATGVNGGRAPRVLGLRVATSETGPPGTRSSPTSSPAASAGSASSPATPTPGSWTRSRRTCPARSGNAHSSRWLVAGSSRWFILTVGRGPWQRDLRGPAADLSLPAVADSDWLVESCPDSGST